MALTHSIGCKDCKEKLWIGQGYVIYTGMPEVMRDLADFITERHFGHDMVVRCDSTDELLSYKSYVRE
jgi:hypothetical protein